jgi:hypothetical protein
VVIMDVAVVVDDISVTVDGGAVVVVDDVSVVVDDAIVVVVLMVVVVVSDFFGLRMTNFNNRERVTTKTAKIRKEMIIIQQRCRYLGRSLFPVLVS